MGAAANSSRQRVEEVAEDPVHEDRMPDLHEVPGVGHLDELSAGQLGEARSLGQWNRAVIGPVHDEHRAADA